MCYLCSQRAKALSLYYLHINITPYIRVPVQTPYCSLIWENAQKGVH